MYACVYVCVSTYGKLFLSSRLKKTLDHLVRIANLEEENRELKRRLSAVENALQGTVKLRE